MSVFDAATPSEAELKADQQEADASRDAKLVVECAADIPPDRIQFRGPVVSPLANNRCSQAKRA